MAIFIIYKFYKIRVISGDIGKHNFKVINVSLLNKSLLLKKPFFVNLIFDG